MREVGGGEGARRKYEWAHKLNSTLFPPSKEYCTCTLYVHYYCIQLLLHTVIHTYLLLQLVAVHSQDSIHTCKPHAVLAVHCNYCIELIHVHVHGLPCRK